MSWVQVNPISRQASGQPLNMLYVGATGFKISVYDIYANLMLEIDTPSEIKSLRGSSTQKDPFIAVVTDDKELLVYELDFGRRKDTGEKKALVDGIYSQKYKDFFQSYRYTVKQVLIKEESRDEQNQTSTKIVQHEFRRIPLNDTYTYLTTVFHKSEIRFVLSNDTHVLHIGRQG